MRSTVVRRGFLDWLFDALFTLIGRIIVWAVKILARLTWWALRQAITHPRSSGLAGLAGLAILGLGWETVAIALGSVFVAASTWAAGHRASFDRVVGDYARTWARRWWTYQRVWERAMDRCGLAIEHRDEQHRPRLRRVATTPYWDLLTVEMQVGQEVDDFRGAAERVRHAFKAERVEVREVKPRSVAVDLMRRDPFRQETVPAASIPAGLAEVKFNALPIGITDRGAPFCVSVVGGHTAGAGMTGAGKAGLIWNVLRALAPAIAAGFVRPIGIDPKGMELRQAISLFDPGLYGTPNAKDWKQDEPGPDPTGDYATSCRDTVVLLERLVDEMKDRTRELAEAGERDFQPSAACPLVLISIDEFAPLLAYWPRRYVDRIEAALGILLTQGRAAGYIVIGLVQEPTKDVFKLRDLFGRRVVLRLPDEDQVQAAMGDQAIKKGARCHEIPESLPGVGFAWQEDEAAYSRIRLGHVTNQDIAELVAYVDQHRQVTHLDAHRPTGTEGEAAA